MPSSTLPTEHLSIGEVLTTLRDEYPDITISKIRFLESQGLIDPERTPSGYRKFYSPDVARLRWILHQQKEHFLPLKVIKGRLEAAGPDQLPEDNGPEPAPEAQRPAAPKAATAKQTRAKTTAAKTAAAKAAADAASDPPDDAPAAAKTPGRSTKPAPKSARSAKPRRGGRPSADAPTLDLDDGAPEDLEPVGEGHLTRSELAAAAGLTAAAVSELEEFGLLQPARSTGDRVLFDDERAGRREAGGRVREARHRSASPADVPQHRRARGDAVRTGDPGRPAPAQPRGTGTRPRRSGRARRARARHAQRVPATRR